MRPLCVCVVSLLAWTTAPGAVQAQLNPISTTPITSLILEGTDRDLGETPVVAEVPAGRLTAGRYLLRREGDANPLPALVYRDQDRTYIGAVFPRVAARSSDQFVLSHEETPDPTNPGVTLTVQGRRIAVATGGKPWTTYVPDDGPKPYFDPLIGPTELSMTRAWPMREVAGEPHDHPHHRSLWFAHIDANRANTWDEQPGHGSIRETARPTMVGGGPVAVLRTTDDWLDRAGRKVCEDERMVHFYATRDARVFDFAVTWKATEGPLRIGDNKDGVFGIRVAAPMAVTAKEGGRIVTSRGLVDKAAWGQPAEWVDYTGPVGGQVVGIALLNHPSSFRFPTTWHVRDYGLFAANPFGWHDFGQKQSGDHTVEPGGSIRLAYRVVLHTGTTEQGNIDAFYRSYANPPRITLR